jgi:hypothetical protein
MTAELGVPTDAAVTPRKFNAAMNLRLQKLKLMWVGYLADRTRVGWYS